MRVSPKSNENVNIHMRIFRIVINTWGYHQHGSPKWINTWESCNPEERDFNANVKKHMRISTRRCPKCQTGPDAERAGGVLGQDGRYSGIVVYFTYVSSCITALLHYCITVSFSLYYYISVLLYYCITAALHHCITLSYHCITVLLHSWSNTVLLHYWITALLYKSKLHTVWRYCCSHGPLNP